MAFLINGFSDKNTHNDSATESKYSSTIINTVTNIRKWLFVPATKIELLAKAFNSGTDSVIVDIEDGGEEGGLEDKAQACDALLAYYNSKTSRPV